MTAAMAAGRKRLTAEKFMGAQRVDLDVARVKVEQAKADLREAIFLGESPSVIEHLRMKVVAAQLAEAYAQTGGPPAPPLH